MSMARLSEKKYQKKRKKTTTTHDECMKERDDV